MKSPFCLRDWKILEVLESYEKRDSLFSETVGNQITLKRNHMHWFQVKGQLLVSGAKFCDFVTYTKQDLLIERIEHYEGVMTQILERLSNVDIAHVVPKLKDL